MCRYIQTYIQGNLCNGGNGCLHVHGTTLAVTRSSSDWFYFGCGTATGLYAASMCVPVTHVSLCCSISGAGPAKGRGRQAGDSPCAPCPATRLEKPYTLRDTLRDTLTDMLRDAHALSR